MSPSSGNAGICFSVSLVQARLLLLLHLVRGFVGVSMVAKCALLRQHVKSFTTEIDKHAWKALHDAIIKKLGPSRNPTKLAHAEGLSAGFSGMHILQALRISKRARALFEAAAHSWAVVIDRMRCKNYLLQASDVVQLHNACKGKIGLVVRKGKLVLADKYTAMSLARSMAQLLASVFRRSLPEYNGELHLAMSRGQSSGNCSGAAQGIFESGVCLLFYIRDVKCFQSLVDKMKEAMLGCRCLSMRIQSRSSITWSTVLVHLCEVRQCLQRYGLGQMQRLLEALRKASPKQLKAVRSRHAALFQRGYAGGSKCHAVWMTEQAASILQFSLIYKKRRLNEMRGSSMQMHILLADYAFWQLSPKLSTHAIPEWMSMEKAASKVLKATSSMTKRDPCIQKNFDDLRTMARSMGHVIGKQPMSRDQLVSIVREGKKQKQQKPTLEKLRYQVRQGGGNPQPRSSSESDWTSVECRLYLLKRKSTSELDALCVEHVAKCAKRSRSDKIQSLLTAGVVF